MLKVYVAGPYTKGNVEQNVLNAIDPSTGTKIEPTADGLKF